MEFKENRSTLANIATLYYKGDMSQDEIAEMYKLSRFKISRILKKCRQLKIVDFNINNPPSYFEELQSYLCKKLNLQSVIVTQSGSTPEESKTIVGKAAAKYLEDHIVNGMKIGVSWGSTIQTMIQPFSPKKSYDNCVFVQLSGSSCTQSMADIGYMDGRDIVQSLAKKVNSKWSAFPVPLEVQSPALRNALLQEPAVQRHMSYFKELDIAFLGIGSTLPEKSISYISGYITLEESKKIAKERKSYDICGARITIDNKMDQCVLSERVLSIDCESLQNIPDSIAVTTGSDKAETLYITAKNRYCQRMIIDEIAALSLRNLIESNKFA